jgi:hypothetical protein
VLRKACSSSVGGPSFVTHAAFKAISGKLPLCENRAYCLREFVNCGAWQVQAGMGVAKPGRPKVRFAADSLLEGDGFELPVREHRAMAPSHGFAAASHHEAALRGAPASHGETAFRGAAGFREARRRHAVQPSRNAVLRRRAGRPVFGPRGAPPCRPPFAKSGRAKT